MTSREEIVEEARVAFVDAWEAERKKIGRGIAEPGAKTRAGIRAALAVFEQAHTPTDDERERVEQSNEVAGIVFDQVKKAWPDLHPVLDLRHGIADALWDAGFRRTVQGEPTDALDAKWFEEWEKNQALGERFGGYHAGFAAALAYCRDGLRAAVREEGQGR